MDRLLSQLSETVPTDSGAAIVHGDYRLDNTIIDLSHDVPSLVAVLDWELSTLGDPLADLAMTLTYWHDRGDLDRIGALEQAIWQDDRGWLVDSLEAERAVDPDALTIVVAEADTDVVCAAWVRFARDTEFATLWGGGTLPAWRRRGIYRATVQHRGESGGCPRNSLHRGRRLRR